MDVVENVTAMLRAEGKGQKELCDFLGVSQSVYSEWKSGKSQSIRQHIDRIADFLGCTSDCLLGLEEAYSLAEIRLIKDFRLLSVQGRNYVQYTVGAARALEALQPVGA